MVASSISIASAGSRIGHDEGKSIVDEIGVEREGSLKTRDGRVVLALPKQDIAKLSASL